MVYLVFTFIICFSWHFFDLNYYGLKTRSLSQFFKNYKESSRNEILNDGIYGNIQNAKILVTSQMPNDMIYFLPNPNLLGFYKTKFKIELNDSPTTLKVGWRITEDIEYKIKPKQLIKLGIGGHR